MYFRCLTGTGLTWCIGYINSCKNHLVPSLTADVPKKTAFVSALDNASFQVVIGWTKGLSKFQKILSQASRPNEG